MDSPLFPTIQRPIDITSSPSAMMSDLSLVATPRRRSDRDSQSPESSHASRASSSHSRSPTRSHGLSAQDEVEETPRKPRKAYSGKPRFSLFAAPQPHGQSSGETQQDEDETDGAAELDDGAEEGDGVDQTVHVPAAASRARSAQNEDKLRESLYELREMNAVFDGFLGALEATKGHNERLAARVRQTSALLDKYTALLGQTEHTQRLLLNPRWTGADDDAAAMVAEEEARRAAEAAAAREAERAEEAARFAEEQRDRVAGEAAMAREVLARGGTTGRSAARGGTVRGRGTGTGTRQPSTSGTKAPATGTKKPTASTGGGLGGKYADVKSSGYGPARRAT